MMVESEVVRRPLRTSLGPLEVLRLFRDRDRLVGLVGDWAGGGAVIAFDPVCRANRLDDLRPATVTASGPDGLIGGGWFGVLGYQLGALTEELVPAPSRVHPRPDCDLAFYDEVLRYVADSGEWFLEGLRHGGRDLDVSHRLIQEELDGVVSQAAAPYRCGPFGATPSVESHRMVVERVLEHIRAGDVFQVNACLRLEATFTGDPLDVFVAGVEALAPAYAAFVRTDGGAVVSLSPELYLERRGRAVRTAPIKGTAPLDADPRALRESGKDRAENIMIVDLMRNDLGRVCAPGSIRASAAPIVSRRAGVWHLVSEVSGRLREDADDLDLIRATFPPGSVTGAPKIRAMDLINGLEATARESYTGAIGWCGPSSLELNVAIRTFEFAAGQVWLGVGGGIVADSVGEHEVEECFVKARPLLGAIGARLSTDVEAALVGIGGSEPAAMGTDDRPSSPDAGLVHVLDDQVVVDPAVLAEPGGSRLVGCLADAGLPIAVRVLRQDEHGQVHERFGVGAPAPQAVAAGPLERWVTGRGTSRAGVRDEARDGPTLTRGRIRVLLIDNYDSFVFNLAQYCSEAGAEVEVVRNDRFDIDRVACAAAAGRWDRVVISPGPGAPRDAGSSIGLLKALPPAVPVLGVCLGLQAIGEAFGAEVVRAPAPVHGRPAIVHHDGVGVFAGLDGPIVGARYHSLVVDERSVAGTRLRVTARTPSGVVMGIRHLDRPVEGLQIHPESVLTPGGRRLVGTFLRVGTA
ncbi:chorismate-binding protein [Nocardioides sp. LMS-CY]|uniref:chorismate-binding protein n=1 Tax=Nocardioides sp. (strain LMS-CY) TaxID=2840457 RepID=UPI001BFFE018|nr:chorismate-binding protein [Nocardioides sp. LMS-CY]QWF20484.1 chorismate-binding protein [Nocardioides sp. LMS-CY]